MRKNIWSRFFTSLAGLIGSAAIVHAGPAPRIPTLPQATQFGFREVTRAMSQLITDLWAILIGVATIFFIVGAYRYLTSQGNPESVKTATKTIVYGLVALAVGLISRGLVYFVNDVICAGGLAC